MKRFFITSSGTGIGKTMVTCALTTQLRARGHSVLALKPVISDFAEHRIEVTDTYEIIQAMGHPLNAEWISRVSPWRFIAPLSPDMASRREGREIDFNDLIGHCKAPHAEDFLLIEGVGGAFVPLDGEHLVADWIRALDIPAVLVCGSYLGTLSHTLSSIEALKARGIALAGLVISESEDSPVPLGETVETLQRFIPDLPILALPRTPRWSEAPDLTGLVLR